MIRRLSHIFALLTVLCSAASAQSLHTTFTGDWWNDFPAGQLIYTQPPSLDALTTDSWTLVSTYGDPMEHPWRPAQRSDYDQMAGVFHGRDNSEEITWQLNHGQTIKRDNDSRVRDVFTPWYPQSTDVHFKHKHGFVTGPIENEPVGIDGSGPDHTEIFARLIADDPGHVVYVILQYHRGDLVEIIRCGNAVRHELLGKVHVKLPIFVQTLVRNVPGPERRVEVPGPTQYVNVEKRVYAAEAASSESSSGPTEWETQQVGDVTMIHTRLPVTSVNNNVNAAATGGAAAATGGNASSSSDSSSSSSASSSSSSSSSASAAAAAGDSE